MGGSRLVAAAQRGKEQGERRSRIELELKTGNFQRRGDIRGRVTSNLVAHSLVVFFRGLFPVPQLRRDKRECATSISAQAIARRQRGIFQRERSSRECAAVCVLMGDILTWRGIPPVFLFVKAKSGRMKLR